MEHVAFVLKINPKNEEEYKKRHQNVDQELEQGFAEVGIQNYRIFYHEGLLFAFMSVHDYQAAMNRLAELPANRKWQRFMSDLLLDWEDGTKVKLLPEVYSFPVGKAAN